MSTKDFSSKQERMVSDFLGWDIVSGSGSADFHAGDVISEKFLGECKTHELKGSKITFRQDVWKKICDEAMVFSRNPVLIVDDGSQEYRRTFCLVRKPADLSFLPKDEFSVQQYQVNFKKQLNFDPDRLYAKFKKRQNLILIVPWIEDVAIMVLQTFNEYQQYV